MINIEGNKEALYQWEKNRRIILTNIDAGILIDFAHEKIQLKECPCVKSYKENGIIYANVPNILLQNNGAIKIYIRIQEGNVEYTEYQGEILVLYRPKPSDYIYTEIEIYNFESVVREALFKAKESGEFNGKDGKDADVSQLVPRMATLGDILAEEHLGNKYHRLYCERNKTDIDGDGELDERGTYARICVTEIPIPPPDPDIYADDADPTLLDAYNKKQYGTHISLNSIPLRTKESDLRVPARTIEEAEALDPSNAREFALSIYGAKMGFVPRMACPDKNRYAYTVSMNSKGETVISLIKMGANPTADVNQPLIRRRVNGAVGTLKNPQADDDAASKYYVDILGDAILAGLDSIITAQNELLGG